MEFDYDLLLEYLSYKNCGKYIHFKNYIKNLTYDEKDVKDISFSQIRRTLSALGHVEFLFDGNKQIFSVAPPVISRLPNSKIGVLCGYRTKDFLMELHQYFGPNYIKEENNYKAPKTYFINLESEKIKGYQDDTPLVIGSREIKVVTDFSKKLLSVYPKISDTINNIIQKIPPIEDIRCEKVYSTGYGDKHHGFYSNEGKKNFCVCEETRYGSPKYYIYRNEPNEEYFEVDKYTAILNQYQIYRPKIKLFRLDGNKLKVLYVEGLPELIDRALTLASGKNRKNENNSIIYDNINEELMVLLCEKTGLNLEVKNG